MFTMYTGHGEYGIFLSAVGEIEKASPILCLFRAEACHPCPLGISLPERLSRDDDMNIFMLVAEWLSGSVNCN